MITKMIAERKDRERQARGMVDWLNSTFEAYPEAVRGRYKLVNMLPEKKMMVAILCFLASGVLTVGLCFYANFSPHNTGVVSVLTAVGILLGIVAFAFGVFSTFWYMFQLPSDSLTFGYSKKDLSELARICGETSLRIEKDLSTEMRFVSRVKAWPMS